MSGVQGTDKTLADSVASSETLASPSDGTARAPSGTAEELPEVSRSTYVIRGELARGGMGKILVAEDTRLGRDVAIKELLVTDAGFVERFAREVRTTARLQHPGIVAVYEAGRWPDGSPFYAMKLVKGKSLEKVVEARPELADRLRLVPNLVNLTEAMAYAHDRGVIHRDLKPANILVGDYGETVVIDWGLAKLVGDDDASAPTVGRDTPTIASGENLTVVGSIVGTPAYMPPEQARGEAVDKRADVYSLGAMIWHVLAGRAPFAGDSVEEVLDNVKGQRRLAPLASLVPDAPPELVTIVERAMHADRDLRYPSARELAEDLENFQSGKLVASHRYSTWQLARRWVMRHRALVLSSVALFVGAGIVAAIAVNKVIEERDRATEAGLASLEEQGRRELLANHPRRAAVYLAQAYRAGRRTEMTRTLLGEAMRSVDAQTIAVPLESPVLEVRWRNESALVAILATGEVFAIDPATGTRRALPLPRDLHPFRVTTTAISNDGSTLAIASDRTVRVFDLAKDKHVIDVEIWRYGASMISLSPSGDRLAILGTSGAITFSMTGEKTELYKQTVRGGFASDGKIHAVRDDGVFLVIEPDHPVAPREQKPAFAVTGVDDVMVCNNGIDAMLLAHDDDGDEGKRFVRERDNVLHETTITAVVNDLDCNRRMTAKLEHEDSLGVRFVAEDASGRQFAVGLGEDSAGDIDFTARGIDTDGRVFAAGTNDGEIVLWDGATGIPIARFDGHTQEVTTLALDAKGNRLASGGDDGFVRLWSIAAWQTTPGAPYAPAQNATSTDGKTTATSDLNVIALHAPSGDAKLARHEALVTWVGLSPNGAHLAAAARDGHVVEWSTATKTIEGEWHQDGRITDGDVSDAGYVATGGVDGIATIWTPGSKDATARLAGHAGEVVSVRWSRAGDTLLTASDTTYRIWDRTGELARQVEVGGDVAHAYWRDDDRLLVVEVDDETQVWDARRAELVLRYDANRSFDVEMATKLPRRETSSSSRAFVLRSPPDRSLTWTLAREARGGEVISTLVGDRVPWRIDDGVLAPTRAPISVDPDKSIYGAYYLDFSADQIEASPTRPRVPLLPHGTGDTAAAIVDAVGALQLGHRQGAARARLSGVTAVDDPELGYALAWAQHWLGDDARAYETIVRALAKWSDAATRDALRADVRAFAAWAGVAPQRALAELGDSPEERLILGDAYAAIGRFDLLDTALQNATGLPRELALARLADHRVDPIDAAKHLATAVALAQGGTVSALQACEEPSTTVPVTHDAAEAAALVRAFALRYYAIHATTDDLRFRLAASSLFALLASRYGVDVSVCVARLAENPWAKMRDPSLSKSTVRAAVQDQRAALQACYARALDDDPALAGVIDTRFTLTQLGRIATVDAEVATEPAGGLATMLPCIRAALERVRLPAVDVKNRVIVLYPLRFERQQ